jgi:hypothetical protein
MFTREQIKAIISAKIEANPNTSFLGGQKQAERHFFDEYCSQSFANYLKENEQVKQAIDKAFDKFRETSKVLIIKDYLQMLTVNELPLEFGHTFLGDGTSDEVHKLFNLIADVIRAEVGDDNSCFLYIKKGPGGGVGRWKDLSEVEAQNLTNERILNKARAETRKVEQQQKWEAEEKERLARLERRENELKELKAKIAEFENEHGLLDSSELFDKEEDHDEVVEEDDDMPPSSQ